jgi:HPt (histidine-containing phosphotransfer) domain-containing protein
MLPKLFSLNTLNEMFSNDKEVVDAIINTFASSLSNDIQILEVAFQEKNPVLIQQTAHRILPFCKQINAHEVTPILEKIELYRKQNNIHFDDLKTDVGLLIKSLKELLQNVYKTTQSFQFL